MARGLWGFMRTQGAEWGEGGPLRMVGSRLAGHRPPIHIFLSGILALTLALTWLALSVGSTRTLPLHQPHGKHAHGLHEQAKPLLPTAPHPSQKIPSTYWPGLPGGSLPACPAADPHKTWPSPESCLSNEKPEQGLTRASWAWQGLARRRARSTWVLESADLAAWQMVPPGAAPVLGSEIKPQPTAGEVLAFLASLCSHSRPETPDPKTGMFMVTIGTRYSQKRHHRGTHMGPQRSCPPARASVHTHLHTPTHTHTRPHTPTHTHTHPHTHTVLRHRAHPEEINEPQSATQDRNGHVLLDPPGAHLTVGSVV